jgi:GT2 family glycosyltransferase
MRTLEETVAGATPTVSVLIVAYRSKHLLNECLASLFAQSTAAVEVIVVDNASNDGTAELVATSWPKVKLVSSNENIGFARAVNLAAARARGEMLVLLNPDTVVHDDAIVQLASFARKHPEAGLVGGRTLNPQGALDPRSCWGVPTSWSLVCFATGLSTFFKGSRLFNPESLGGWARDEVREVGMVSGCLLAVPRTVWKQLGGFDSAFFMYGEDLDLSIRASRLGYRPMITPDAVITHLVGASTALRADRMLLVFKGRATVARKHGPLGGVFMLAIGVALRAFMAKMIGQRQVVWRELWIRRSEWIDGYPRATRTSAT